MLTTNRTTRLACALLVAGALAFAVWPSGDARGVEGSGARLGIAWNWLSCVGSAQPCVQATGMRFPKWLAPTRDGRSVYVSAQNADAIVLLARNAATGAVQQPSGAAGCVVDDDAASGSSCTTAPGLDGPQGLAVAPDGDHVYVTANASHAVSVLGRDDDTGALHTVQCLSDGAHQEMGCEPALGLAGAANAAVSPDGASVYVVAVDSHALTTFRRNPATGALTQTGCVVDLSVTAAGCTQAAGLKQAFAVTLDPDGENVYVAARGSSAVTSFKRDAGSGALTPLGCLSGDRGYRQDPACDPAIGMQYVQFVVPSPDGRQIYASATDSHTIGVFTRGTGGALKQAAMPDGCVQDVGYEPATPCHPAIGLALPLGLAFTQNGYGAYAAEFGYGTLTGFERNPDTGALTQVDGCLGNDPRCEPHDTLQRAGSVAVLGDQLFVTAAASDAINILRPARVEVTPTPTPTPWPTPTPEPPDKPRLRLSVSIPFAQGLGRALRRGLRLSLRCTRACRIAASITVSRKAAVRHRLRRGGSPRVLIGDVHTDLAEQHTVPLRIRFRSHTAARLSRTARIAVRLRIRATDDDGNSRSFGRRIVLRRRT